MTQETIGQARTVKRRTPTFPSKVAYYWDLTPWGGGFVRTGQGPGAGRITDDVLFDLRTGRVYRDSRFKESP